MLDLLAKSALDPVLNIGSIGNDLVLDVDYVQFNPIDGAAPANQLITSKSLCTPGCGKTGTGNSYCC